MLTRNLVVIAALSLSSLVALAGCSADVTDDAVESGESDLAEAASIAGSYKGEAGAFHGLILGTSGLGGDHRFIADVDTGIRCVTTPCPSSERVMGTFSVEGDTLTLRSESASSLVQPLLGEYSLAVDGARLVLRRDGASLSLTKVTTYCSVAEDCKLQGAFEPIHPMCLGGFTCSPENTCRWSCDALPVEEEVCLSSDGCSGGKHCSTEDGVCKPYGMLAVCAGTCVD